jgi:putative nucleotidyltransferase with HDIG domain
MTNAQGISTSGFLALTGRGRIFVSAVIFLGLLVIAQSAHVLYSTRVPVQWFILAALTLLSGSITIKLPSIPATLSVSETFVFTSVLLFGTAAGTITVALDGLIISLWLRRTNLEFHKLLFNTAAPALSIWLAAQIFFGFTGASPLNHVTTSLVSLLPGLLIFAVTYFLLNSFLMATAVSLEEALTPMQVWRDNFLWLSVTFLSGASVSILLVSISREINLSALAVIVPLLVISYLTQQTSMGRLNDANRHVDSLNRLYLSTIETLAMAIDAKDQVTHGHIRRVQEYSVELALHLGVNDKKLVKAIEAASLLHDMGKLAIPEYILNKPGKLTHSEFDVMKTHASVGADILAAIEFPYPVVPIVRHHHENWDGSGYPDGLSGTDIPLGARILSVVDCYDALTSDRPYRPKLTSREAVAVLRERRGSMYDPLVVDAFLQLVLAVAPGHAAAPANSVALGPTLLLSSQFSYGLPHTGQTGEVGHEAWQTEVLPYSLEVLATYLTSKTGSLLILYIPDATASNLIVARAWGAQRQAVDTLKLPMGKRLSGWVAVAATAMFSAGPALDFVNFTGLNTWAFGHCAAVPVRAANKVVAVLTSYRGPACGSIDSIEPGMNLMAEQLASYLDSLALAHQ